MKSKTGGGLKTTQKDEREGESTVLEKARNFQKFRNDKQAELVKL